MNERLVIRFDGPPGPTAGRFIEVELGGKGVSYGEWEQDGDDWLLVLPDADARVVQLEAENERLRSIILACPQCNKKSGQEWSLREQAKEMLEGVLFME